MRSRLSIMLAVSLLAGCGSGGPSGSGAYALSIQMGTAPWAILDVASGTVTYRAELGDVATNPAYRRERIAFRRVGTGASACFVAAGELTQYQWFALAGTSPWLSVPTGVVPGGAVADDRPAYNLDYDTVAALTTSWHGGRGARLRVPTDAEWLNAAGCTVGWAWGTQASASSWSASIVARETGGWASGPQAVGGRSPNALGIYDIAGNVWEWTAGGSHARGGSWFDGADQTRAEMELGAAQGLGTTVSCALVGFRPVLTP